MLVSKVKEQISDWEKRKIQNSKLPPYKRLSESDIELDLSACEIREIEFICELQGVSNLNLANNLIEDITALGNCKDLSKVMLNNNLIQDALPIRNCEKIIFVNFVNNKLPFVYGEQKKMVRDSLPDAQIHWDSRLRTPNLFG